MNDSATAAKILNSKTPAEAKRYGRMVSSWDDNLWNTHKYDIMKEALLHKFTNNKRLSKTLLNTGNAIIAEAAPNDRIWGIGISVQSAKQGFPWKGSNLLGKALMDIRSELI